MLYVVKIFLKINYEDIALIATMFTEILVQVRFAPIGTEFNALAFEACAIVIN